MNKIVVIGSSNTDLVVRTLKMPRSGETVMGGDLLISSGGKGANQAVAAARAGGDVTFIASVGEDDFGERALGLYQNDNINTENIKIEKGKTSGVALIIVSETTGQNSIVVSPGANQNLTVQDILKHKEVIRNSAILLIQLEISLEVVSLSLKLAKEKSIRTVLNPAPAQKLSDEILERVDILTPNETETEILTGVFPHDEESAEKASRILLDKVKEAVVITMGEKGVFYLTKTGEEGFIKAKKVDAVDTTAAGDVFNGYLTKALVDNCKLKNAILLANEAAAISVTREGAQTSIPHIKEVHG